ncbi:Metallo-beta-lactamase type 2 [Pseudocercospora fuligena]|uniref:Metallo-beta-lactamase type 2 n=1 Tax=Pseudocercospora fuligena TaxID=685502 RepID=A0A8H6RCG0_9PEZI|nr:Metallo-beta-lactamase type 2 [Pseudocercospora fuligena]
MPSLRANIYVAPPIPFSGPNGKVRGHWSPISSTLIHGEKEAVLVDTPITKAQNKDLADWVERTIPTKKLITLYITHGHADHWLGIGYLQKRFPGLKAVASRGTIEHMKEQIEPNAFPAVWGERFQGQLDEDFVLAEPLPANGEFHLEGCVLKAVEVGHSDTHDSTVLWVPDIKLAVCGDVVYGDVHQMLAYAKTKELREEWIRAIEKVEDLGPELVVAGHKKADELDGVFHLEASKQYIRDFGAFIEGGAKDARELGRLMLEKYPTRFNPGALYAGCMAAFPSKKASL